MSYIILNNKKSTEISGLIIQTLPPISKPKRKTRIEEIDGVDGDIITELGYSAYDKEFSIGLSFNYDIDKVIEYFDSKGTVTFSNETDKIYKYEIYEQIDFNSLLRFKTATVKMHIQPFKYLKDEEILELVYYTNEVININNEGNTIAKPKMTIYGKNSIDIYINNKNTLKVDLGDDEYITIDGELMEAYKDNLKTLKNRLVIGSYDNFILKKGNNTINFNGTVERVEISNYSRWI